MKLVWVGLGLGLFLHGNLEADVVCQGKTAAGERVDVTLEGTLQGDATRLGMVKVSLTTADATQVFGRGFIGAKHRWDGHLKGEITGPDFRFTYENHFGCIRNSEVNVKIDRSEAEWNAVSFPKCTGGTTPDRLCPATTF